LVIPEDAVLFPFPGVQQLLDRIPRTRPRVYFTPETVSQIRDPRSAAEAKRRLLHFMTWDVDGPSSINGPTELGMDIAEHAPRTFDWIDDTLTEEEHDLCIEVLGRRIRQINRMHRGRPFESRPYSSHPGRMIGFAVEGGIVLAHEVPDAPQWLDYTLQVLWSVYPAWGRSDGGWHEGVSYWTGYMSRMFRVVAELDRLGIPLKDKPFLRNTGDFGLWAAYPDRPTRAFGDGYEGRVGQAQGDLMYTLSSLYDNPYYRWYAEQMGGGPTGPESLHVRRTDLEAKPPDDLPLSKAFYDIGLVAMHSRMAEPIERLAAEEGTALRIGEDEVLIRDPDSETVRRGGDAVEVRRGR
jgi:hypothetical protein